MTDPTLTALIDAYLDGNLAPDAFASLANTLREDPTAAREFARRSVTHRALRQIHTPERTASADRPHDAAAPQPLPIYRKGHEPRPKSETRIPKFAIYSGVAAALLAACGLAAYFLVFNADPSDIEHRPSHIEHPPLANLIENASEGTLTTPGGFISEGRDYPRGEYALDKGTAEFMLTNSVNVKLRGETRMSMHTDMSVSLSRGSAEFVVPAGAVGFAVRLPHDIRVVDLGTRFRVDVRDEQQLRVTVIEGSVRVDGLGEPQTLARAQSLTIEPDRSYALSESDPSSLGIEPIAQWASNDDSSRAITPFDPALNPRSFTFEAWVRLDTDRPLNQTVLMSRALWDADALHWTSGFNVYAGDSGRWEFWTGTGPNRQRAETPWHLTMGDAVEPRRWTHLVVVFDAHREDDDGVQIGTKRFYVNGRLAGEDDDARYLPNATAPFVIGGGEGQKVRPWQGDIRAARFFDEALPQDIIEQLHADGLPAGD